ncbi:MAG: hypothetical protein KJ856_00275 [Gammaproteobacteria bacterium]|nr:hypothetical protein [Gammaproteobacteria bacterium]MBU1479694.1 hypothetical protein [Gammaproteobacteria bacterium]MBU1999728.1 hypothetical protein [Gammaproteobacteria bacterium]MBU2133089.1 hypothetical protein [Gammaproteobacteria bacterium]MBU2185465.1 hypothetical protein [Gammaproteobacteria bacterium]
MANRSYLYSANHLPESPEWEKVRDLHSIAEWNYDIPVAFKLLLAGNPSAVKSSIWETAEKIAIAGDFQAGITALNQYLSKLPPQAETLVTEAREFLSKAENEGKYFILECGEIFDMDEGPLEEKNLALIEEIKLISQEIQALVVPSPTITQQPKRSFVDKLLGRKQEQPKLDPLEPFYGLGLGNWSNILYFQFGEENA